MNQRDSAPEVLRVGNVDPPILADLLGCYGLRLELVAEGQEIPASFWGDEEAGLRDRTVFVRADTPVHSVLHEACHVICMTPGRRASLDTDAGGDDLEEAAVCYLQVLLADELADIGKERLMRDMDAWGYSFRLGDTAAWFMLDAEDARAWLEAHGLIDGASRPTFHLRR